ncbi:MAG: hypothetical protein QXJ14_03705 [Candidatus Aenigmatarchaeota archaeon]
MDIRKRLKEIEEILPGDYGDLSSAKKYLDSIERSGVNKLLNIFKEIEEEIKNTEFIIYSSFYEMVSKELNFITYSLKDIEDLCPIIKGDEDRIGIYISAAINKIIKDGDEVRLNFRNRRIDFIGMYLSKGKVIVEGDVGNNVGHGMKGGSIHIKGNARSYIGYEMENGNIIVKGNAGDFVGSWMKGGSIHIKGNAGVGVGFGMENGNIIVKGNAGDNVGYVMIGGIINIKGNARNYVGSGMENGSIHIKGNAGSFVGFYSKGGEIRIDGEYKSIWWECEAKIYHKGKLIKD